jgi:hypothetical protein
MVLTINPEFANRQVSHHGICKTIDKHSPKELRDLAIEARKSNNRILLECFDELPTLEDLMAEKTNIQIAEAKTNTPTPPAIPSAPAAAPVTTK